MKKHVLGLFLAGAVLALTACGGGNEPAPSSEPAQSSEQTTSAAPASSEPIVSSEEPSSELPSSSEEIPSSSEEEEAKPANGLFTYVKKSYEERTKILGKLEKWAVDHKLTGLTCYGNGGYVMYDRSVSKGTNNYIPGYGFGILTEGELTADLFGETNPDFARYYHTYETDDPGKINYMDDKGSVVGDLIGYVSDSYFGTFMNETKDGYDWVPSLSKYNRPVAVNPDEDGYATKYKIYVLTGDAVKYATNSATYAKYNGQAVTLEDYVTPYKIYYTSAFGMARGNENLDKAGSIAGSAAYYEASKTGFSQTAWDKIGIKSGEDDKGEYLEFTFNFPTNRFYAMYYLSNSMFAPVPAAFIEDIGGGDFAAGVKNWGVASDTETIVDHWLCTGPYTIERWDSDQQIVFKKNPFYAERDADHYKIGGVHVNILKAQKENEEAAFNEFLAGKLHATSIPSTKLDQYKTDPRTTMTADSSTYKLNLNTCDQETWVELFGENGSITQTEEANYWECEPAMSNPDFADGLSFALDRATYANAVGRTPTGNYFGNAYLSDPENGIRYNETQEHKDAVAALQDGTVDGYSLEKAKASFKKAAETLIAEGEYSAGETIEIEIAWQTQSQADRDGALVKNMFETAFNTAENPLKLEVVPFVPAVWSDVYYKKMMVGQFDIGFGSVSGNTLDPINFLEVLKSDNSSTFTLNWGIDTDDKDGDLIEYDGKLWTFDALWTAADQGAAVKDGAMDDDFSVFNIDPRSLALARNDDGSHTISFDVHEEEVLLENGSVGAKGLFAAICIFGCSDTDNYSDYEEYYLLRDDCAITENEGYYNTHVEATFDAEVTAYFNAFTGVLGWDVYADINMLGSGGIGFFKTIAQVRPGSLIANPA